MREARARARARSVVPTPDRGQTTYNNILNEIHVEILLSQVVGGGREGAKYICKRSETTILCPKYTYSIKPETFSILFVVDDDLMSNIRIRCFRTALTRTPVHGCRERTIRKFLHAAI